MRTLQAIFDTVIRRELYPRHEYMCNALSIAVREGYITPLETKKAKDSISKWLSDNDWCTVRGRLHYEITTRYPELNRRVVEQVVVLGQMDIYTRWHARPRKTRGSLEATLNHRIHCWIQEVRRSYDQP